MLFGTLGLESYRVTIGARRGCLEGGNASDDTRRMSTKHDGGEKPAVIAHH